MTRVEHQEVHKPLPLLPSHPPPLLLLPPPPPPRSQDSSSSSGPFDLGHGGLGGGVGGANVARRSNSSDGLLDRVEPPEDKVGVAGRAQPGTAWLNGAPGSRGTNAAGGYWSSDTSNGEGGGRGGGAGGRRDGRGGGGYSEVLLDYVWGKQQQLQRPPAPPSHQPTTSQHHLYNGYASSSSCPSSSKPPPPGAPPTYRAHHADQQRVKVTRTKSCGPFLPVPQGEHPVPAIQPDPHPHLLPPRAPQLPPHQDSQLEEATRSLHKALALEGLRDWYLRNTIGSSHQNQINGKVPAGGATPTTTVKLNGGVKGGQAGGGGALQRRRTTHGVLQQPAYQAEAGHHHAAPYHKQTLPHSATFHGHPLHDRSVDGSLYQDSFPSKKQEVALRDSSVDQPSPGTLV